MKKIKTNSSKNATRYGGKSEVTCPDLQSLKEEESSLNKCQARKRKVDDLESLLGYQNVQFNTLGQSTEEAASLVLIGSLISVCWETKLMKLILHPTLCVLWQGLSSSQGCFPPLSHMTECRLGRAPLPSYLSRVKLHTQRTSQGLCFAIFMCWNYI